MESSFLINAMALKENGLEKSSKTLKFKNVLLSSKPLIRFARLVVICTCDNYFILLQTMSPHVWQSGIQNPRLSWILLHEVITRPGYHLKVLLKFTCTIVSPKARQNLTKHLATFRFELLGSLSNYDDDHNDDFKKNQ